MISIEASTYPIHFKENAYLKLNDFVNNNNYSSIFVLVDENTLQYCYPFFVQKFSFENHCIEITSGEEYKNINTCIDIWNTLTNLGADRNSLLITLGGGVITDLGGFVASTFKRGIDFINIPTTLLSMVDASVGGKTGIDLEGLKNQIGLFSNPEMVLIDPKYLQTLEAKEIRSGTAEIIKHGLIYDINLYNQSIIADNNNIDRLIHRSIEIKNEVVLNDPKEKNVRKILNFGHTIGHAIESYFLTLKHKEKLTHGESVAIGMICACYISYKLAGFSIEKTKIIKQQIITLFGKVVINENDSPKILELLKHDKKNIGNQLNFVLLTDIEKYKINCNVSNDLVTESLLFYNDY